MHLAIIKFGHEWQCGKTAESQWSQDMIYAAVAPEIISLKQHRAFLGDWVLSIIIICMTDQQAAIVMIISAKSCIYPVTAVAPADNIGGGSRRGGTRGTCSPPPPNSAWSGGSAPLPEPCHYAYHNRIWCLLHNLSYIIYTVPLIWITILVMSVGIAIWLNGEMGMVSSYASAPSPQLRVSSSVNG